MADTTSNYKLHVEWVSDGQVIGSIGEEHSFYDWAVELGLSAQQFASLIDHYDGSAPGRPLWFEDIGATPVPGSYDDLSDTPPNKTGKAGMVPMVNLAEDAHEYVSVPKTSDLADVATSGDYDDLSNKPTPYSLPSEDDLSAYLKDATDPFARMSELPPGGGDVIGPASSVLDRPALFSDTTGKLLKQGNALGGAAYLNIGVTPGTVCAADDPRLGALPPDPEVQHLVPYARKTGQGVYDLEYVYGLNWRNGMFPLKHLYSLGDAQVKFAKLFSWYLAAGKGTAWIMNMTHYPACHNEAVLQGHTAGNWGNGRVDSRNQLIVGAGHYLCNSEAFVDGGKYKGVNSSGTYQGSLGTVLIMDEAGWQGNPTLRLLHRPTTLDSTSIWNAYQENLDVRDFRYEGLCDWKSHNPAYVAAGIGFFRAGENATVDRLFSSGFNGYGMISIGATPLDGGKLSLFSNTYGGLGLLGGSLSSTEVDVLSGDDNPALLRVDSFQVGSDPMRAGGAVKIGLMKCESGKRDPQRGQIMADIDGHTGMYNNEGADINLNVGVVQYDMDVVKVDSLFVVNGFTDNPQARGTTSGNRSARINVGSLQARGHRTIVHDIDRKQRWASDGDYVKFGFTWNARLAGDVGLWTPPCDLPAPLTRSTVNSLRRLGVLTGGTYDYAAGTPAYDETTVVPVISPPSDFQVIYAAVDRGIITTAQTAQCRAVSLDYYLRTMSGITPTWNIVSGPATINGSGLVTPTGTGDVVIRASGPGGVGYCYLKVQ